MRKFIRFIDKNRKQTQEVCLNISDVNMVYNINGEATIFAKDLKFSPEESYEEVIQKLEL